MDSVLDRLVQVGTVMAVDPANRRARVIFRDVNDRSGWLYVLQHAGAGVNVASGGNDSHSHGASLGVWMPEINQQVLVLYLPFEGSDGFILGVV